MMKKNEGRVFMEEKTIATKMAALTAALLTAGVLALSMGFVFLDKQEFSENENRYLEKLPKLSWEKIESGEYMEDMNAYLCDHFPLRDFFIGMKSKTEIALGKREINQVYIAGDGFLIEEYKKPENTEQIAGILKAFGEKEAVAQAQVKLMLVPTASSIYQDKLPAFAPVKFRQMETAQEIYQISGLSPIDCSQDLLAHKEEGQLYYRTDHHWTTYGAYIGYLTYCREAGLEPVRLEDLEAKTVTEDFKGTIYSKVNDYSRPGEPITVYENPADRLTVYYEDTKETTDSLYNLDYVEQKDKYSLFLNNLHPLVEITNETADTERELVVIKDSYANSMVPFLVHHFKKLYVFDTRYYKWGPSAFIGDHPGVTDVLILYNMNTLDTDLGVRGIF